MRSLNELTRRELMARAGLAMAGFSLAAPLRAADDDKPNNKQKNPEKKDEEEISPVEDLMREHGVLNRMLLIYEQQQKVLAAGGEFNKWAIGQTAGLIRQFIEEYHERLEEKYVFPRFKQGPLAELSQTLLRQHAAGRRLTDAIQTHLVGTLDTAARARMADQIGEFIRMYRPHEAREDTVLFPALQKAVPEKEYEEMGEEFERREHELFGEKGFAGIVEQVEQIERQLGLYDLEQFTPKA